MGLEVHVIAKRTAREVVTGGYPLADAAVVVASATTIGELEVNGVNDMVAQLEGLCRKEQAVISRLNIIDHVWVTGEPTGHPSADQYAVELHGDIISQTNIGMWEQQLRRVGMLLADRGFVHLWHCKIGRNETLLKLIARHVGKDVYAGTGNHSAFNFQWFGSYVVAGPDGTMTRDVARPAMR